MGVLISFLIWDADQDRLDLETKTLQSYVKEKSLVLSESGALADTISPGILKSLVTLKDERKWAKYDSCPIILWTLKIAF